MPFFRSKSSKAATDQLMNKESKIKRSFHKSGHRRIKQVSSSTQQTSTLEDERFWLSHSLTEEEDDIEFLKQELPSSSFSSSSMGPLIRARWRRRSESCDGSSLASSPSPQSQRRLTTTMVKDDREDFWTTSVAATAAAEDSDKEERQVERCDLPPLPVRGTKQFA